MTRQPAVPSSHHYSALGARRSTSRNPSQSPPLSRGAAPWTYCTRTPEFRFIHALQEADVGAGAMVDVEAELVGIRPSAGGDRCDLPTLEGETLMRAVVAAGGGARGVDLSFKGGDTLAWVAPAPDLRWLHGGGVNVPALHRTYRALDRQQGAGVLPTATPSRNSDWVWRLFDRSAYQITLAAVAIDFCNGGGQHKAT